MSESELAKYYDNDYWGDEPTEGWIRRSQSEKTRFLADHGPPKGRILDVGAGAGYFLRALDRDKWQPYAIENGDAAARSLTAYFGSERVHHGTILNASFENEFFDAITFWSALEHMNQPRQAARRAAQLLKPNGTLIVQVPNANSYQLEIFQGDWFALDAPRHRYHFSLEALERLLRENDLKIDFLTFASKEHNLHALRQSMKTRFGRSGVGRFKYLSLKPFTSLVDRFKSRSNKGATITLAATKG